MHIILVQKYYLHKRVSDPEFSFSLGNVCLPELMHVQNVPCYWNTFSTFITFLQLWRLRVYMLSAPVDITMRIFLLRCRDVYSICWARLALWEQMGEQWPAWNETLSRNHLMLHFTACEVLCLTLKGNRRLTARNYDTAWIYKAKELLYVCFPVMHSPTIWTVVEKEAEA